MANPMVEKEGESSRHGSAQIGNVASPPPKEQASSGDASQQRLSSHLDENDDILRRELERVKLNSLQNMHSLVRISDISCKSRVPRDVLYFTSRQAHQYTPHPSDGVNDLMSALNIKRKPKLVIRLLESWGLDTYISSLPQQNKVDEGYTLSENAKYLGVWRSPNATEVNVDAREQHKHELALFLVNVVIPLAARTDAIILCSASTECTLASTLASVMASYDWDCVEAPFTTVAVAEGTRFAYYINNSCKEPSKREYSAIADFMSQISDLQGDKNKILQAAHNEDGPTELNLPRSDLLKSFHKYIFVAGCAKNDADGMYYRDAAAPRALTTSILGAFSSWGQHGTPTLAIRTFCSGENLLDATADVVDMVTKSIPTLLLDSRSERSKYANNGKQVCERTGAANQVEESLFEYKKVMPENQPSSHHIDLRHRIVEAVDAFEAFNQHMLSMGKVDNYDNCSIAFFHRCLHKAVDEEAKQQSSNSESDGESNENSPKPLFEAIRARENDAGPDHFELNKVVEITEVAKFLLRKESQCKFQTLNENKKEELRQKGTDEEHFMGEVWSDRFMQLYRLLSSNLVYSASLWKLSEAAKTLNSMVVLETLPEQNTLGELRMLHRAWCIVDEANSLARMYKRCTKAIYILLLLTSVAIVALTTLRRSVDEDNAAGNNNFSSLLVFVVALSQAFLAGLSNFLSPGQKWQQLRGTAVEITSEIYMFRTRTGDYKLRESARMRSLDDRPEMQLHRKLTTAVEQLLKSADLERTALLKLFPSKVYCHGQYEPKGKNAEKMATARGAKSSRDIGVNRRAHSTFGRLLWMNKQTNGMKHKKSTSAVSPINSVANDGYERDLESGESGIVDGESRDTGQQSSSESGHIRGSSGNLRHWKARHKL